MNFELQEFFHSPKNVHLKDLLYFLPKDKPMGSLPKNFLPMDEPKGKRPMSIKEVFLCFSWLWLQYQLFFKVSKDF